MWYAYLQETTIWYQFHAFCTTDTAPDNRWMIRWEMNIQIECAACYLLYNSQLAKSMNLHPFLECIFLWHFLHRVIQLSTSFCKIGFIFTGFMWCTCKIKLLSWSFLLPHNWHSQSSFSRTIFLNSGDTSRDVVCLCPFSCFFWPYVGHDLLHPSDQ